MVTKFLRGRFALTGWPVSPGGRLTFFASPKKVSKERRPYCLRPFAALRAACGTRFRRSPRKLASLRQRAALIRLKLRSSAQTEGVGSMRDRNPYCPFSPWEKAGMRASGVGTPASAYLAQDDPRLRQAFVGRRIPNRRALIPTFSRGEKGPYRRQNPEKLNQPITQYQQAQEAIKKVAIH